MSNDNVTPIRPIEGLQDYKMIEGKKYEGPTQAVNEVLISNGFDRHVKGKGWVELRIVAQFGEDGAMFHTVACSGVAMNHELNQRIKTALHSGAQPLKVQVDADAANRAIQGFLDQMEGIERIMGDIATERCAQDEQWGGPDHDDEHDPEDWADFIHRHARKLTEEDRLYRHGARSASLDVRGRLVKLAALSFAAIESYDRKNPRAQEEPADENGEDDHNGQ